MATRRTPILPVAAITAALLVFACAIRPPSLTPGSSPSAQPAPARLAFGPIYTVSDISDPLVAKAVAAAQLTEPVSAEIRGYLVDWVQGAESSTTIVELVVMKDGSIYRLSPFMRPAAALHARLRARLSPEPPWEARMRALAVLRANDAFRRSHPAFVSAKPTVWNYLVRIHQRNGKFVDVWVDPDVGRGRLFYGVTMKPASP